MKNKSTLMFYVFLISCSFSLVLNAQKQKANNSFSLSIVNYSDKPNSEKDHVHVLKLTNNSPSKSEYSLTVINNSCSDNDSNKLGTIEKKQELSISSEIYYNDSNKKYQTSDVISLNPDESIQMKLKTYQKNNAVLNSWNCSSIQASKISKSKSKDSKQNSSESFIIKTYIPNPANQGH